MKFFNKVGNAFANLGSGNSLYGDQQQMNLLRNSANPEDMQKLQQFKRQGFQNLADVMGVIGAQGDPQRMALAQNKIRQRKVDEENARAKSEQKAAYDRQYNLLSPDQKRIVDRQNAGIKLPTATDRKTIKGADGFNYYMDGTRVLPGVETSPEKEKRTTIKGADGFNYYMDGTRVLPNVIGKEETSDRKYLKSADGFYRYTDDGSKVFGDDIEIFNKDFIPTTEDNPMGLSKKDRFDRSDKLSDDFRAGSKDFIVSRDSMKRILDAANDPSPFGDLSIIFSAMKVLDPNSVVRESEFKTVADAAPLLVRLGFSRDKIEAMTAGNKLTDTQRADVVGTVLKFYNSATSSQNELQDFYAKRATQSGLKPEDVIFDYSATVVPKIEDFNFILNLQTMSKDQLTQLDRSEFTEKQKELFLKELKKLN